MATDPIARLRRAGRSLPTKTRAEILALGPPIIPRLVDLLGEDESGSAAIHAVDLLVDMKAVEAVGPMLQVLNELDLDDELSNRITIRLPELGSPVLEPALELLSKSEDEDTTLGVCEVLATLGVRDDRVFDALRTLFEDNEMLGAGMLADYGDERGLPLVDRALAEFEPDFTTMWGRGDLVELLDAHERLGGDLAPEVRERVDGWLAEWAARQRRSQEGSAPARKRKVGRNEPCPCGSGKKYKKCCLAADEAARPRAVGGHGDPLLGDGNVSSGQLAVARKLFAEKEAGRGPAQQMAEYAQPIVDATDGSAKSVQAALNVAMLFWNLAVARDDATRERDLEEMKQRISEAERDEFERTARMMIERHRAMFPEMHGLLESAGVATR